MLKGSNFTQVVYWLIGTILGGAAKKTLEKKFTKSSATLVHSSTRNSME